MDTCSKLDYALFENKSLVLVLARMELTFFIAASVVLCLGFWLKHCRKHTSVLAIVKHYLQQNKA